MKSEAIRFAVVNAEAEHPIVTCRYDTHNGMFYVGLEVEEPRLCEVEQGINSDWPAAVLARGLKPYMGFGEQRNSKRR